MKYEAILNKNHKDTFSKLKYGFENKDTSLTNFKDSIKTTKEYRLGDKQKLENLLKVDTKELIKTSIPNSFALQTTFTLQAPYYSSDDDEFYIINNPCLKEKVFKVPMMRGSSLKGALLNSARDIIQEQKEKQIENLESYFRIFGVGDESFREIVDKVDDNSFKFFFMLGGLTIDVNDDVKKIFEKYKKSKAQKGRAIFYPTYFDKLSLELINPHNRKTKEGKHPIHYEVIPKGSNAQLQIVYIPFDAVLETNKIIEKEAKTDLEFLKNCINKALNNGIGGKTKLGWGKGQDIKTECFWSDKNECK